MDYTPVGLSNARGRRLAAADATPGTRVNTAISRGTPTRTGCPLVPSPRLTWSQDPHGASSRGGVLAGRLVMRRGSRSRRRGRDQRCAAGAAAPGRPTHLAPRAADVLGVLQYDETEQNWVKQE